MKVGVLSLQGDVREHIELLRSLDAAAVPVNTAEALSTVDALVLPGGESTTVGLLLREEGMLGPLQERVEDGFPLFGTCAGAILLAREVRGGDVPALRAIDIAVRRNAYGRQVDSFEANVDVAEVGPVAGAFIRAPVVEDVGPSVNVLARHEDDPVVLREARTLVSTFHPEISADAGLHRYFLEVVCA